jgi:outer membrane lipoprotein-sorting protein
MIVTVLLLFAWGGSFAAEPGGMSAVEVLTQADEARGNLDGIRWSLQIEAHEKGQKEEMTMGVVARGFDVLATTTSPRRSKGNRLLILKENMWFDTPDLSKPVPISRRQKLVGQAAYGDIATTNYASDYDPVLIGEETVDGMQCLVYDLRARNDSVTYDRIKYWIDKERLVGIKAEYYTVSGRKFKSARMEYDNRVNRVGRKQPFISRISIFGELVDMDRTILTFTNPVLEEIPDYVFDLSVLR